MSLFGGYRNFTLEFLVSVTFLKSVSSIILYFALIVIIGNTYCHNNNSNIIVVT